MQTDGYYCTDSSIESNVSHLSSISNTVPCWFSQYTYLFGSCHAILHSAKSSAYSIVLCVIIAAAAAEASATVSDARGQTIDAGAFIVCVKQHHTLQSTTARRRPARIVQTAQCLYSKVRW
jgi:hypothetical protein